MTINRVGNQMMKIPNLLRRRASSPNIHLWLVFLGILICYALLILPTINRLGVGWDEATDMGIARTYLTPDGLLLGSSRDPSQTRLPMFTVAVVFQLFGTSNLLLARITTVFVGALTILGIFLYGKDHLTPATGLLAAGLLAINPFFLSFARLAFTESDVYLACVLAWLLFAFSRLQEKPTIGGVWIVSF
jgi:4-amino-4-deoxy-L-arabinose transferase-like glycosyltransferase